MIDWLDVYQNIAGGLCLFTQSKGTWALLQTETLSINQRWEGILEMQSFAKDIKRDHGFMTVTMFAKTRGAFETFPKIHPFCWGKASLEELTLGDLSILRGAAT